MNSFGHINEINNKQKTAYELADELLNWTDNSDAANMLRQQADRIAELEKELSLCKQSEKEGWRYADELEYHRKQLSANAILIPCLSTPQTKPLSDEEIAKEWSKFYPDVFHTHLIDFARAIEERHGIK